MNKKQGMDEIFEYVESVKDKDGNAVIDIDISSGEIYNPLSINGNQDLKEEIYEFIDEQANVIPASVPLCIRFHGRVKKEEQDKIRKMMRKHYVMKSYDITWDIAANLKKMLVLGVFGVLVLGIYFYLTFATNETFLAEILSILGTFSLWEVSDAFLIERRRLRRRRRNLQQNIEQTIEFVEK